MNKEYIYINGNIIVEDEKGQKRVVEYSDNFEKILVQENIIEKAEKMIASLERKSLNDKHEKKIITLSPFLAATIIPSVFTPLLFKIGGPDEIIDTIFGQMKQSTFVAITTTLYLSPLFAILSGILASIDNDRVNDAKGKKLCIEYLKNYLETQKDVLLQLHNQSKTLEGSEGFKTSLINDQEEKEYLDYIASLYYDLGRNLKKYIRYYNENNNLEKLNEHISVLGYENVINILENSATKERTR